ncbi:MAG TPA: GNAT family N-acetyltransferase [Mycobacteriales bacterium]|nr:GNAT family N-acetyltransferase [Mycobacteriales bacterium]
MSPDVEFPVAFSASLHEEVHRVIEAVVGLEGAVGWLAVPGREETRAFLSQQLGLAAAGEGAVCLVRDEGVVQAVGFLNRFSAPVVRQNAEIRKVMVHPDARGRGLGRVVVTALLDRAVGMGVEVVLLDARGNNHGAHALYESLGFERRGSIPDFIAVGDERWDRVFFSKRVTTPPGVRLHGSDPVGPGAIPLRET